MSRADAQEENASAVSSLEDRYLRLTADFDNYRRRTAQLNARAAAAQKEAFIRELLPVVDNLEQALASDASTNIDQLRAGVGLIADQITQLLRQHGIVPEESLHTSFDPHRHEAQGVITDPSQPDQTILEVYRRGYRRGDEVFRPAQVVVNELNSPPAA